ncbi:MAG: restriction endonuclease subunit M [Deltaproteobacteria bacterium]|nr:restriction endonuclease subunit M [Deltaproteobacteria bacterium]
MSTPREILNLVERFSRNLDAYRSGKYNETQLRREFIDPFFKALDWDVDNAAGHAEAYKDVIHEDAIKVGSATKAPDYSFRIGGVRKFFVETKKPSIHISEDPDSAYQLRRYAWSAKLPLSILTNFEELVVYDCTVKPKIADKTSIARVMRFDYRGYEKSWDDIASVFSKEAILKGSFDRYAESANRKRGTAGVDAAFLSEIEEWRQSLAQNIALRNPKLTQRELNFSVGRTIDRIIFLRICEDRGIEPYGQLMALLNGANVYHRLKRIFYSADDKYNSGLFHFREERGRYEPPDDLTLSLTIDDKPLKEIFRSLYYPESPYEFSVLPADILGQVYEQFLGKVIYLTPGHRAKVEDKPEVKKAGGVYYTPTYIVDYIVKHTVGKLLEGKKPGPRGSASKIRILDPACGSGSFLIGAYQYLLDWYRDRYVEDGPEKWAKGRTPALYQVIRGEWRLTTAERKRILLNNIYGVDIDPQAVEVTKLSLLLKVMEGENEETLANQLRLFRERALPDLGNNIKCGNSLIGPDFYDGKQVGFFDEEEQYRVNVFDWEKEFLEIMKTGGFDAVIGNPPYIFNRDQGIDQNQKKYFYANYKHQSIQLNTFGIFIERCYDLLQKGGYLGFIMPNNWLTIDTFAPLRQFILENTSNLNLINILDKVFQTASVDTAIIHFIKDKPGVLTVAEMENRSITFTRKVALADIRPPVFIIQIARFKDLRSQNLLDRINQCCVPLSNLCVVSTGLKAYQTGKGKPPQTDKQKKNRIFHASEKRDSSYGKYLDGVDVSRYCLNWSGEYLSYGDWLAEPRKSVPFDGERLLIRQIPSKPPYLVHAVFVSVQYYHDINSMVVFSPISGISLQYILGCINSRLVSFWFARTFDKLQRKIFPQFKVKELSAFPVPPINFSDPADKARHDRMVALVEQIFSLHKKLTAAKTDHEKTILQRQIDATDSQVDRLVYELYGLTDEEIEIVERK